MKGEINGFAFARHWITEVKSPEARARHAGQIAERLLATMEAELELPPILQVQFARDSRAREGWSGCRLRGGGQNCWPFSIMEIRRPVLVARLRALPRL